MKLSLLKNIFLPWHTLCWLPATQEAKPYFGPYSRPYGGADLKIRKLKKIFGNHWFRNNVIYITSGKPIPLSYARMAKNKGYKIVMNQDGVYLPAWYKGDWQKENKRIKAYQDLADHIFYQSQFSYDSSTKFVGTPNCPHEILYNAVDTNLFQPSFRPSTQPTWRLLYAAYFNPSNSYILEKAIEVVRLLKEQEFPVSLQIAGKIHPAVKGNLSARDYILTLAEANRMNPYVTYLGSYGPHQFADLLSQVDILLHLKFNDPCPSTVLEAMAAGVPVVYGNSGGTPELVKDAGVAAAVTQSYETKHLPTTEAIANAVKTIAQNYRIYSDRARLRVLHNFSMENWIRRHQAVFDQFVEN